MNGTQEIKCHCGFATTVQNDDVLGGKIVECENCSSELCFEEAMENLLVCVERASSFYANNAIPA